MKKAYLLNVENGSKTEIGAPEKNKKLGFLLLLLGLIVCAIAFFGFGGFADLLGIIFVLLSVSCLVAGVYQLRGVCKCTCPYCETEGYMLPFASKYKCKTCEKTSVKKQ